jgi:hypothetical protein
MSSFRHDLTPEVFNGRSAGHLPGLVGLQILTMTPSPAARPPCTWAAPRDAVLSIEGTGRKIALFRCTRMVLWAK